MTQHKLACQASPDDWFAKPGTPEANRAKTLCMHCPKYWQCQEYAIKYGEPYGIFGGMDEEARHRIWANNGGRPTILDDAYNASLTTRQRKDAAA